MRCDFTHSQKNSITVFSFGAILIHGVTHGHPDHDAHVVYSLYQPASNFLLYPHPLFTILFFSYNPCLLHWRRTQRCNTLHDPVLHSQLGIGTGDSINHSYFPSKKCHIRVNFERGVKSVSHRQQNEIPN